MTTDHDLESRLADFYAIEASPRAPDRVLQAALATIEDTRQRRAVLGLPWRLSNMNAYAKLAVAAVAVVAVVGVWLALMWGGAAPPGEGPTASPPIPSSLPSPSPSSPATIAPSPTSAGPALTETFTSDIHGISISYPDGWAITAATEPWTTSGPPTLTDPAGDFVYDPARGQGHLFLALASQPLSGMSPDEWASDLVALLECGPTEPVVIDGAEGVIATDCHMALISTDGRGYVILLYVSGDDPGLGDIFDRRWFEDVLATVELRPEDAVPSVEGVATEFRHPFAYTLQAGWEIAPIQADASYEFRIPGSAAGGQSSAVGVILRAIDGGRVDPCADSAALPITGGPEAVIDYLSTLPGVQVTGVTATTIDGLPAVEAVIATQTTPDCPDLRPFAAQAGVEVEEVITRAPPETMIRATVFDIGGGHVVIWTWAESDAWVAVAEELIASFDFE